MRIDSRVVLDTNVLVSAVLRPESVPRRAVDHVVDHGTVLLSAALLRELHEVLARPKLAALFQRGAMSAFLMVVRGSSEIVAPGECINACRDPKDNMILELAVNGRAGCVITGDGDLLGLHPFRGIAIVTPAEFLQRVARR